MDYFSPQRPKSPNGLPLLRGPDGRGLYPIPALNCVPKEPGVWRISAMLPTQMNNFRWFTMLAAPDELNSLFLDFLSSPEEFFTTRLGWAYEAEAPAVRPVRRIAAPSFDELFGP